MDKIQGQGRDGDFVHNSMEMSDKEDFGKVAKVWFDTTLTYEQGLEQVESQRGQREDIMSTLGNVQPIINEQGKFAIAYADGREYVPDEWGMKQLATRCFVPHTVINDLGSDIVRPNGKILSPRDDRDTGLLVNYFKNGIRHHQSDAKLQGKKYRFRTYTDGTLRAVLTETYSPVDNRWYLELMRDLIPGGRLSHWRGNCDTIYGNILIPDSIREEDDSDYGGMISIGNCEIGKRRISQLPSVFRAICRNGMIWDRTLGKALNKVHKGIVLDTLKRQIAENIQKQIPLAVAAIDNLLNTQQLEMTTNVKYLVAEVVRNHSLRPKHAEAILSAFIKEESSFRNLFGLVNSVTRAGQTFDDQTWFDFDVIGGELSHLDKDGWDKFQKRASNMSEELMAKTYGIAV